MSVPLWWPWPRIGVEEKARYPRGLMWVDSLSAVSCKQMQKGENLEFLPGGTQTATRYLTWAARFIWPYSTCRSTNMRLSNWCGDWYPHTSLRNSWKDRRRRIPRQRQYGIALGGGREAERSSMSISDVGGSLWLFTSGSSDAPTGIFLGGDARWV